MNKDNARDYLPLVQALAEGKVVQMSDGENWEDLDEVTFSFEFSSYRIKPESREIWVNRYQNGLESGIFYTEDSAKLHNAGGTAIQVRYREVIE